MSYSAHYLGWALALVASFANALVKIEPPKQKGEVRCSQSLSLKDIFDAGFRPFRVTESWCSVGKADLNLVLPPSNLSVPLDIETISFAVSKYDTVTRVELSTPAHSVKQTGDVLR